MNIRKISLIKIAAISFLLAIFSSASAYAQPQIASFSGSLSNGSTITINGNSFGANGPNIVVFDDFEGGTNGSNIKIGAGSATIGEWTSVTYLTPTPPKYSNVHSLSGSLAFRGDATVDSWGDGNGSCTAAYKMGFTTSDIFVSYWYYFPTTSDWPCLNGGQCGSKIVWITGSGTGDDDRTIADGPSSKSGIDNYFNMFGNNSISNPAFSPALTMAKGKWYRFWAYFHGEGNANDHEEVWVASPSGEANIAAATRINRTTQIWYATFNGFNRVMINGFNRLCNDCAESAPTFDDVYVAIGTGARARVEIGDAATYATSKNLTIATVTSWSDTSITATIRQGSFDNLNNAYLYVIDSDGNVNANGYLLTDSGGNTPPPSSGSGGDSGGGSGGGGGGCGFVKDDNGKGQKAKGEGLAFAIMLIITLTGIALTKYILKNRIASIASIRNKNKYKLFFIFLFILFILTLISPSQEAYAQVFLSEDWDTGTPPSDWPCKKAPAGACDTNAQFNGWFTTLDNCIYSYFANTGISTARAYSGTKSFYINRLAGYNSTCDIRHDLNPPYPTKINIRFYMHLDSNWVDFNTPVSRFPYLHFMFTNSAQSGTGFRINLLSRVAWGNATCAAGLGNIPANQPYMFFNCENDTTACGVGAPSPCYNLLEHLNEWQCVEFGLDAANKKYNVWINGTKYVDNVTVPMTQDNFTMIQFSQWVSDDTAFSTGTYIDNIVVSDSYIGCNGSNGDTQAPTVPTGLSGQAISSSQINLSWTASTDNVGVTGYRIYRNNTQVATTANTPYSDTGLSPSTTYTYTVSAYDAANNVSAQSNSASATTAADTGGNSGSNSGGDSSASGGSGCGYIKDANGKGQGVSFAKASEYQKAKAKGEGLSLIIMLIITLVGITLRKILAELKMLCVFVVMVLLAQIAACGGGSSGGSSGGTTNGGSVPAGDSGRVQSIKFITYGGAPVYSTALNKIAFHRFDPTIIGGPDLSGNNDNTGTFELWIADPDGSNEVCISCGDVSGGPRRNQHKGAPTWRASGQWIVAAVEMPVHAAPHARAHAGLGAYLDLWAISPDGAQWYQLTYYANIVTTPRFPDTPAGALIPRFSRSGNKLVWAEMIGYDAQHPFAIWRLVLADFVVDATGPHLINHTRFEPGTLGTTFYEAWSFSPDDNHITVASESGGIHPGYMDVQIWDPNAGTLVNLTQTNDQYEEQAVFSPDGQWIAFMSTQGQSPPYDPSNDFWGTFRTDVWLMRADGTSSERLSYFSDPAHAEYLPGAVNRAVPVSWSPDGKSIYVNVDQNHGSQQTHETQRIYRINLR